MTYPIDLIHMKESIRLYSQGHSLASCAEHLGLSVKIVRKYLRLGKVPLRTPTVRTTQRTYGQQWTVEKIEEAVRLYSKGRSLSNCARSLKSKPGTVCKYLRLAGVRVRPHIEATLRGEHHGNYNHSGKRGKGYVYIRIDGQWVLEHRHKMEQKIGRKLKKREVVHHIDKNPKNNDLSNLMLFASNAHHLRYELKGQVPRWSEEGLKKMKAGARRGNETMKNRSLVKKRKRRLSKGIDD